MRKTLMTISAMSIFIAAITICSCSKNKAKLPVISTKSVTEISQTSATSGGEVTDDGGAPITSRGVCWNTTLDPTIANSKTTESGGTGSFSSNITQLAPNNFYYVRAYATNSTGTGYGNQITFTTTQVAVPILTSTEITSISSTTAISGGNITTDNGALIIARGVCWSIDHNPDISLNTKTEDGTGTGSFISNLSGLQPGITYYVRAYATNSLGTSYGNETSFNTPTTLSTVSTIEATSINQTNATSGGNVLSDGGVVVLARGICWSTTESPTINNFSTEDGSGIGTFASSLEGLMPNTTYYVRAYATNSNGTAYGNQISLATLQIHQIADIDGNIYNSLIIGTQTWMIENLKTTKFNDDTVIPNVTNGTDWNILTTPGYCWYNNEEEPFKNLYGALYNWYTVNSSKLCPIGWHTPTNTEWTTLTNYLGGASVAGGKMKEIGETHWQSPNTGATNESGFTALPGGHRGDSGAFGITGSYSLFWSSTESDMNHALLPTVTSTSINVAINNFDKKSGLSVRCLKDN